MKTLDNLLHEREKLLELIKYAKLFDNNVRFGSELIGIEILQEMLNDIQVEIETQRSQINLKVINNN